LSALDAKENQVNILTKEQIREHRTDFTRLREIANAAIDMCELKDRSYGASWKRRGGPGAFMVMARKWDRLEAQMEIADYNIFDIRKDAVEDLDDTILDLVNYLLLIMETRKWIQNHRKTADTQPIPTDTSG
jgi:hypothetical protein